LIPQTDTPTSREASFDVYGYSSNQHLLGLWGIGVSIHSTTVGSSIRSFRPPTRGLFHRAVCELQFDNTPIVLGMTKALLQDVEQCGRA
jgi:hypothetical protein